MAEAATQQCVPPAPPKFDKDPVSIVESATETIKRSREQLNFLTQTIRIEDATFANTLCPLAHIENSLALLVPILTLYQMTTTDLALRKASDKAQKLYSDFAAERTRIRDLFKLVDSVLGKHKDLDMESRRFLNDVRQSFIRNGLTMPFGPEQIRLKEMEDRVGYLKTEFYKNKSNERVSIWFTPQELIGMPQDIIDGLQVGIDENKGKLKLEVHNFNHSRYFSFPRSGEVRKQLQFANSDNHIRNIALLKEVVILRNDIAHVLGYANRATLRLENRMAKTPEIVNAFLTSLQSRIKDAGKKEIEELKAFKQKGVKSKGETFDGCFYPWDYRHYNREMKKQPQKGNESKFKFADYFSLRETVRGALDFVGMLFGLKIRVVVLANNGAWHEDVEVYSVWDEEQEGGSFLGFLYLDIFARDGKDSSPRNFNLHSGFLREDGSRQFPSTALLCSFPKSTPQTPSLLEHSDLVALLHELGHSIHNLVSKTTYSRFHGTNAALDFAEAPSQMLENWCWTKEFLKSLGRHYSTISPQYFDVWGAQTGHGDAQPAAEIPDELIENLIKNKSTNSALFTLGQVQLGMFDMMIHEPRSDKLLKEMDLEHEFDKLTEEIQLFDVPKHDTTTQSRGILHLSHLLSDYDVGYYSYLFSEVYATDMFYTAFRSDPMNREQGRRYRHSVLEKGGSQDEMTTLRDFLGRDPSVDAFYISLGLA